MAKKGIALITGLKVLKLGEVGHYHVSKVHKEEDYSKVSLAKWVLYVKENNNWRELKPVAGIPPKIGNETTITVTNQKLLGKELLLEAYLYKPEKISPPGLIIKVEEGQKKIERVDLFRNDDTPIPEGTVMKYGQSIIVKVITVNMANEKVEITLYEEEEKREGVEKNSLETVEKIIDNDGFTMHTFKIPIDFQKITNAYLNGSQNKLHVYYINVKPAFDSNENNNGNLHNPEQEIEEVIISVKAKEIGVDPFPLTGRTNSVVKEALVEDVVDAYFAKKVYVEEGDELFKEDGVAYLFKNAKDYKVSNKKVIDAEYIYDKTKAELNAGNQFTTVEEILENLPDIIAADTTIKFKTFKMQESYEKINAAPLEDNVYLVVEGVNLNGKEATIIVKEKDGLIKGSEGDIIPLLQITEEEMEQEENSEVSQESQSSEETEFKGIISEGSVRIPVRLRPESDEELMEWREKIAKGVEEEKKYKYKFNNPNGTTINDENKKRLAAAILVNAKEGKYENQKIEAPQTAYVEDIEAALENKTYSQGETVDFKLYKKVPEELYLQVKVQGEKELYDKEFLKEENKYFKIANPKEIIFPLLVKPENDQGKQWGSGYYWAAAKGNNQAAFNSNRGKGTRKHAGRDLYTLPETTVVAICKGKVLEVKAFYAGTDQVTILHETNDGRKFIIRYGELAPDSIKVKKGDDVFQKQELGFTGKLHNITVISGENVYMIHFEHFTGLNGYEVENNSLTTEDVPFNRRTDLIDSLEILQEGYRNTFDESKGDRVHPSTLSTSNQGKDFIKDYEKFRDNAYDDSEGYCTIGFGYLIAKNKCENLTLSEEFQNGITEQRALELFETKLSEFENAVRRDITVNLYQYEFDALVSLLYNTGVNFLNTGGRNNGETQIKIKINNEDYNGGADEFLDVTNGGVAGLVIRRSQEINMFKNNIYDSTH